MFSSNANPDKIPGSGTKAPTSELKQAAETAGQKRKAEEALVIPDALNTAVGAQLMEVAQPFLGYQVSLPSEIPDHVKSSKYSVLNAPDEAVFDRLKEMIIPGIKESIMAEIQVNLINPLVRENADLKARVDTLETENADLKARVATLETENVDLKARVTTLETQNTRLNARVETLETETLFQSEGRVSQAEIPLGSDDEN
jgi:cell division protein FtsB